MADEIRTTDCRHEFTGDALGLNVRCKKCGAPSPFHQTTAEADLFWDDSDPEYSVNDITDIVDNYADGEVVRVRRAVCLHDVFAVRVGDDMREFDTLEEASVWADGKELANGR